MSVKASSKMHENWTPKLNKQIMKAKVAVQLSDEHESSEKRGYLSVFVLPLVLHLGFLAATAFFCHACAGRSVTFVLSSIQVANICSMGMSIIVVLRPDFTFTIFQSLSFLVSIILQVATRFMPSSRPIYWFAAYLMASPGSRKWEYMIWAYFVAYILLGTLLLSNFYPFT